MIQQNEFRPGIMNYLDRSQPITTLGFNHHGIMFLLTRKILKIYQYHLI